MTPRPRSASSALREECSCPRPRRPGADRGNERPGRTLKWVGAVARGPKPLALDGPHDLVGDCVGVLQRKHVPPVRQGDEVAPRERSPRSAAPSSAASARPVPTMTVVGTSIVAMPLKRSNAASEPKKSPRTVPWQLPKSSRVRSMWDRTGLSPKAKRTNTWPFLASIARVTTGDATIARAICALCAGAPAAHTRGCGCDEHRRLGPLLQHVGSVRGRAT